MGVGFGYYRCRSDLPKFCISNVSSFYWDLQWSQEKTKTMLIQNLGRQTKSIMVFPEVAYFAQLFKILMKSLKTCKTWFMQYWAKLEKRSFKCGSFVNDSTMDPFC